LPRAEQLEVRDLGRIDYSAALTLQDQLVEQRLRDEIGDTLLLLEHPPTITLGRRGARSDIYASDTALAAQGIGVHQATRGGLVTYHGPGQLVGYPIVNLRARELTVPCYVRALEQAVITTLAEFGIRAYLDEPHVGVWTDQGKIAAVGVAQRHGITLHGFAVNLQPDLAHFALINPCGLADRGVTSAAALLGHNLDPAAVKSAIAPALNAQLTEVSCRRPAAAAASAVPATL
jgi:lipoate-protein ligase B